MNEARRESDPERAKDFADEYFAAADALKKTRPHRGAMNFIAVACFVGFGICAWGLYYTRQNHWIWLSIFAICLGGFSFAVQRFKGTTQCPKCRNDFTCCPPVFCHICGKQLENERCESCAVDWSLIGCLGQSSDVIGNKSSIQYCPGCGVLLNSEHRRYLPEA